MKKNIDKPLYTKINNTCHGAKKHMIEQKKYNRGKNEPLNLKSKMVKRNHGIDFTPLFGFLRKNVGKKWDEIHSIILKRLPSNLSYDNPLNYSVLSYDAYLSLNEDDKKNGYFRYGESTTFSQMYIDKNGILQYINPDLTVSDLKATCKCCTHTFNGKIINNYKKD